MFGIEEYFERHFQRINRKLNLILQTQGRIMADEAGLDQALADLSAGQDELSTAV